MLPRVSYHSRINVLRSFSAAPSPVRRSISLVEVGPRDGLQNEKQVISTGTKLELIQRLVNCGLSTVEVGSLVSTKMASPLRMRGTRGEAGVGSALRKG